MSKGHLPKLLLVQSADFDDRRSAGIADWVASVAWSRGGFRIGEVGTSTVRCAGSDCLSVPTPTPSAVRRVARADAVIFVTAQAAPGRQGALEAFLVAVGDRWRGKPVAFVEHGDQSARQGGSLREVVASLGAVTVAPDLQLPVCGPPLDACGCLRPDAPEAWKLRAILAQLLERARVPRHAVTAAACRAVA